MASSSSYLQFVLDQLSDTQKVSFRPMMGEYLLYSQGKLIGGIYDDRFLVKNTPAARDFLKDAPLQAPYPGGKEMILVTCIDDKDKVRSLLKILGRE